VIVPNSEVAFSFFRSIFLGEKVVEADHEGIIQHELVHIKQRHSLDLLFFELMRIVGWFNPLVYIYQNRISEMHEFIADAQVTKTHKKEQYQLLLSQVFQTQNISFINQFHQSSLIKKRIVMLTKAKSKQILKLKYLVLAPVVMAMLVSAGWECHPVGFQIIGHRNSCRKFGQSVPTGGGPYFF
jgi:beta-lactamase regulating signal transducer with metallopeptidase domain